MDNKLLRSQWIQFSALVFGAFIAIEAMVFQAPAIPAISQHFEIPTHLSGLIILSFYIASTALYPIAGRVSDQIGRKRVLLFGMTVFFLSEVAAAISPNFSFFLVARVFQGFSVACILPVAIAYIGIIFPPEKRGFASGIFTAVQGIASTTGAVIAGFLVKIYGWSIIYWISAVLALIGLLVVKFFVPESKGSGGKVKLNFVGALLILLCTGCLLSVSTMVSNFGISSPFTLGVLACGIGTAIILWFTENRNAQPILELSLLKKRLFAQLILINLIIQAAYQAFIYAMNFFISTRPNGDVSESGLFYMFIYAASVCGSLLFGKLIDKFNNKKLLIFVLSLPILTLVLFSFITVSTSFSNVSLLAMLFGFGLGSATPIFIKNALSVMPEEKYGSGSGLFSFIRDFGAPLGSVTGIVLFSYLTNIFTNSSLRAQAEQAGVNPALMGSVEQANISGGENIDPSLATELTSLGITIDELIAKASSDGLTLAIQNMAYILIGIFAIALVLSFFLPTKKRAPKKRQVETILEKPVTTTDLT